MLTFYTNWFSPFARKVALALEYKEIAYEAVDGLARANHQKLRAHNPRGEVPSIVDGEIVVSNSADILVYLDDQYPDRPIFPKDLSNRVKAREIERYVDARIDSIIVDCSLWVWSERPDERPAGMLEAGQKELDVFLNELEQHLADREWYFDAPGVLEFALFPHLTGLSALGFAFDKTKFANVHGWLRRMRHIQFFSDDIRRTVDFMSNVSTDSHERQKIFWRGDRIEWVLANGYHDWFFKEIAEDRVLWPG